MNRGLSLYLDVVRVFAALVVLVTHLAYVELSGGMLQPWRLVGNDAVMVFFVLSGFVIAFVRDEKEKDLADYAASRLARLWSVALPALLLTLILDGVGRSLAPAAYDSWWYQGDQPMMRLWSAATFTNELWFGSVRPFSNGPYWSLGYEFWYYAIFAAATYLAGARRTVWVAALCLVAGPKILLLLPVWWLGVLVYRRTRQGPVGPSLGLFLFAGSIIGYIAFRASGLPLVLLDSTRAAVGADAVAHSLRFSDEFLSSFVIGPLVAAHFLGAHSLSANLGRRLAPAAGPIQWFAQFTFAIYLVHYPLLRFIGALVPYDRHSPLQVALVFAATLAGCIAVGSVTERFKPLLRRRLGGWMRSASPMPVRAPA